MIEGTWWNDDALSPPLPASDYPKWLGDVYGWFTLHDCEEPMIWVIRCRRCRYAVLLHGAATVSERAAARAVLREHRAGRHLLAPPRATEL